MFTEGECKVIELVIQGRIEVRDIEKETKKKYISICIFLQF